MDLLSTVYLSALNSRSDPFCGSDTDLLTNKNNVEYLWSSQPFDASSSFGLAWSFPSCLVLSCALYLYGFGLLHLVVAQTVVISISNILRILKILLFRTAFTRRVATLLKRILK